MTELVSHSRPTMGEAEALAAERVVLSGRLAQGDEVRSFEREVAAFAGRAHGVAVSSGTVALSLALRALNVRPGDQVMAPSYVCTALLHAIWAAGATPVLCDIDPETRNLDVDDLVRRLDPACRAVIAPHMFGLPVAALGGVPAEVPVVEDCAMSLGAEGVGAQGAISVCSFYATKVLTSGGEGGMVLTNSVELADAVRGLREYDGLPAAFPRLNCKMTDLGAAIGRVQLRRLPEFVSRRREIASRYDEALGGLGLQLPPRGREHIYYRYVVGTSGRAEPLTRSLKEDGVIAHSPLLSPLHRELGMGDGDFPCTAQAHASDVSLPIYPTLSDAQAEHVTAAIRRIVRP